MTIDKRIPILALLLGVSYSSRLLCLGSIAHFLCGFSTCDYVVPSYFRKGLEHFFVFRRQVSLEVIPEITIEYLVLSPEHGNLGIFL